MWTWPFLYADICLRLNSRWRVHVWRLMATFADWKTIHSCLFFFLFIWSVVQFIFLMDTVWIALMLSGPVSDLVNGNKCASLKQSALTHTLPTEQTQSCTSHAKIQPHKVCVIQLAWTGPYTQKVIFLLIPPTRNNIRWSFLRAIIIMPLVVFHFLFHLYQDSRYNWATIYHQKQ